MCGKTITSIILLLHVVIMDMVSVHYYMVMHTHMGRVIHLDERWIVDQLVNVHYSFNQSTLIIIYTHIMCTLQSLFQLLLYIIMGSQ